MVSLVTDTTARRPRKYVCFGRQCSVGLCGQQIAVVDSVHIQWNRGLLCERGSGEVVSVETMDSFISKFLTVWDDSTHRAAASLY
jgi:hypothetical protein